MIKINKPASVYKLYSWASLLLVIAMPAHAGQEVARIPFINAPPGTAGLGGGLRFGNNPYISSGENEEVPLDLIPLYLYEGKYLFAHGTSGGIHLFRNDKVSFSALVRWRFQQLDPSKDSIFAGLERRYQTLDAGFTGTYTGRFGSFTLDWVTDTLDKHNGQEVQLSYRYDFTRGAWSFSPFITWGLQNENLANYYFGVSAAEATAERPAYDVGEAQYFILGVNTSWQLTDSILLFGNIGFGGSDDAVANSPLVDKPNFSQAFVGGTFMFGNVLKPVAGEDRVTEWSWRVNYGYQAEGNIISEVDQGGFSKSSVVDTNIGGITFSRLLTDGKRIDFLGRLAFMRHFEEGVTTEDGLFTSDRDFWSYNAYIMVMGKGYSPWSGDEVFRWGFGFGMSYAEQVPLAEQSKQASKGDNTSKFLNYLELQVDFPLRRLSKARWLQDCYVGATVVHRSGIFGTSNLLGDVSGGADWITAHLECVRR
jgi:outer membrane scaffolding protein for murein synthesis (MipA/OmpV family)